MNSYANLVKDTLLKIIKSTADSSQDFRLKGKASFSRKRKWDLPTVIRFILSLGSNSLGYEIGEFFGYAKDFPTVSSFVQQRKKLSYSALEHIFHQFTEGMTENPRLFKGYRLLAIDGSDLTLPYNPKEDNVIGSNHVSTLHLNALFDVCNKTFVDAIVQKGLKENECGAACELVERLTDKYPVIITADRGYENYNLFAHTEERLFDYVIRVRDADNSCMVSGLKLPAEGEYDITRQVIITRKATGPTVTSPEKYRCLSKKSRFDYVKDSKSPDYEMTIRFVRFKLTDNNYEILATSLPEELFSADDLKEIYRRRWGIETGFRELKYILGLSAFHSKHENSVLQEVFARLIMYNYSMFITSKIRPKEKDRRYQLQVNFTQATNICRNFFKHRETEPAYDIEATIQRFLLPIRPNRKRLTTPVGAHVVSFNYRLP